MSQGMVPLPLDPREWIGWRLQLQVGLNSPVQGLCTGVALTVDGKVVLVQLDRGEGLGNLRFVSTPWQAITSCWALQAPA